MSAKSTNDSALKRNGVFTLLIYSYWYLLSYIGLTTSTMASVRVEEEDSVVHHLGRMGVEERVVLGAVYGRYAHGHQLHLNLGEFLRIYKETSELN